MADCSTALASHQTHPRAGALAKVNAKPSYDEYARSREADSRGFGAAGLAPCRRGADSNSTSRRARGSPGPKMKRPCRRSRYGPNVYPSPPARFVGGSLPVRIHIAKARRWRQIRRPRRQPPIDPCRTGLGFTRVVPELVVRITGEFISTADGPVSTPRFREPHVARALALPVSTSRVAQRLQLRQSHGIVGGQLFFRIETLFFFKTETMCDIAHRPLRRTAKLRATRKP